MCHRHTFPAVTESVERTVRTMANPLIDVLEDGDDDVVRFVTGNELPLHVWQTHADGRIETKVLQAPRIVPD